MIGSTAVRSLWARGCCRGRCRVKWLRPGLKSGRCGHECPRGCGERDTSRISPTHLASDWDMCESCMKERTKIHTVYLQLMLGNCYTACVFVCESVTASVSQCGVITDKFQHLNPWKCLPMSLPDGSLQYIMKVSFSSTPGCGWTHAGTAEMLWLYNSLLKATMRV